MTRFIEHMSAIRRKDLKSRHFVEMSHSVLDLIFVVIEKSRPSWYE